MPDRAVEVLLVGGGVASVRCARALRRNGFAGQVLLVTQEPYPPYNRPPLSKEALRDDVRFDLLRVEAESWYARRSIEVVTGARVSMIDRERRVAELDDGTAVRYGRLLLATGAAPRAPAIRGADRAQTLRTVDDAIAIRSSVRSGSRVAIVGGGFIGVEVAASLAAIGAEVTLLEVGPALWAGALGADLSAWAARALIGDGIAIKFGAGVTEIREASVSVGAETVPSDFTILCVGVSPRDELARISGLACQDGIVTDVAHRTTDPHIFSAGDVARVAGRRVEHWHAAREGGERAAMSMIGERPSDPRAPWIFSDFGGRHLDVLGTARAEDRIEIVAEVGGAPSAVAWVAPDNRVVQLAVTDGAVAAEVARDMVESGTSLSRARRQLSASA